MQETTNSFQILPHTADMRMKVWGKTLQELFKNALCGMAFYLKPEVLQLAKKVKHLKQQIRVEAVDINSLLVEFLSEVIAQSDINNVVFTSVSFQEFGENFLEGILSGSNVERFEKDIKAVSYHEVDVKKNPETGFFETMLVFDI